MGQEEFNTDISEKGDINIYICGNINYKSNRRESIYNYTILTKIFEKLVENGKIKSNNDEYSYEFRKLIKFPKNEKDNEKKNYNAFLFFNEVDEKFSRVLVEEHLYDMDVHNQNKNVIIYFGENNHIQNSFNTLYEKSKETIPFLVVIKNVSNYSEELKYINYIPNIHSIKKIISDNGKRNKKLSEMCKKALFNFLLTKLHRIDMYYNQLGYNYNMLNPFNEINLIIKTHLTIALVGYSGCGKSTLINLMFNDLVCRASSTGTDVTKKCSEYYLPIKILKPANAGQIRFLDFPGISEEKNYKNVVEPEIERKVKEYRKNKEQIDIALFYIPNGIGREFTNTGLELVNLLHKNKIKIIFIINGEIKPFLLEEKKKKVKNLINNNEILYDDFSNLINTDYFQYLNHVEKNGISNIIKLIINIIKINNKNFKIEEISINNYNEKLNELRKLTRLFEHYKNMNYMKESIKSKASWTVAGFSALSCGTSALSILVPLVDTAISIGYQVAMVYSIFSLYGLDTEEYKIKDIILSGGNTIELEDKYKINKKNENIEETDNKEIIKGNIRETVGDTVKGAIFAGKMGLEYVATKEASKIVLEKSVETLVKESVEIGTIKASILSIEATLESATRVTIGKSVEQIAVETSKELVKQGITQGTKITLEASKGALITASSEGIESAITYGTKESIKTVTESIVVKQGGKVWLINLGKAVPFIGAGISAFMNTFSTAKIGIKLVNKLDQEFENNRQRQVDIIKGKVYGLNHIIEQLRSII